MDKGLNVNFYGNEKPIRRQLEIFVKSANNVENIEFVYEILDKIKKRRGYEFPDLREKLDKKLSLISQFNYS